MAHYKGGARGFTLVEVIVVAVIVLILSAVAIPLYNGFVRGARQDAAETLVQTAAAAANSYYRKTGSSVTNNNLLPNTSQLSLFYNSAKYSITVNNVGTSGTVTVTDRSYGVTAVANYR